MRPPRQGDGDRSERSGGRKVPGVPGDSDVRAIPPVPRGPRPLPSSPPKSHGLPPLDLGLTRLVFGAAAVFGVLLLPSIVGFQERYLYLPAAASCLVLAALIL